MSQTPDTSPANAGLRLTVGGRLLAAFSVLAALLIAVAATAVHALGESNARLEDFVDGINARAVAASKLRLAVDTRALSVRNMVLADSPEQAKAHGDAAADAHGSVQRAVSELVRLGAAAGVEQEALDLIEAIRQTELLYAPVALEIVTLARDGRRAEAIAAMNSRCLPLLARLMQITDRQARSTEQRLVQVRLQAREAYARQRAELIALVALALLLSILAGWWVRRSVVAPLRIAVAAADRVAAGDLQGRIETGRSDETGLLLRSLQAMSSQLDSVVGEVRRSSIQIEDGTREIANGNADLSARTERQAANVQETSAAMRELVISVRSNATDAQAAASMASEASRVARESGEAVRGVAQMMTHIAAASGRMQEVVGLIDQIAFQTNILALNAAVEAARAGPQGKGFAVVASEVRQLAGRCSSSAQDIKRLILDSASRVAEGSQGADSASATMGRVEQCAQGVNDLVRRIQQTCAQQSVGIQQVDAAVGQLDEVTQQNAALVEESAAAAASLSLQAEGLVKAVNHFQLRSSFA